MQRSALRRAGAVTLALSLAAAPLRVSFAQTDTERRATAQALYNKAVAAMDKGDYATACPALAEVVRLSDAGLGAKLTLAQCYEGAGKLASAWAMYAATEEAGLREGRADRWKPARARKLALEPKLAHLTLVVPPEVQALPGLSIERDGVPVGAALWQVAVPIDRGKHVVTATATGKQRWEKAFEIGADGERVEVTIDGPRDAAAPKDAAPKDAAPKDAAAVAGPAVPFWSAPRIAGAAVAGLGAVGLGVGGAFGLVALGKQRESNDGHCDTSNRCDAAGRRLRDEGRAAGNVSTALFIAGGVVLGAGVVIFATAPKPRKAEVSVVPGGLLVRGTF